MTSLKNLLTIAGTFLTISSNAQTQDTLNVTKTSSVIEETYNKDKLQEKKEYIIENFSQLVNNKIIFEREVKYSFKEKNLGKPTDPKEKNIENRKQIDKIRDYVIVNSYEYDSLGRITAIKKTDNYSQEKEIKKSAIYYTYSGKDENPIKLWEDLNNNGKFDDGDKMKIYISELDKWVSQGE